MPEVSPRFHLADQRGCGLNDVNSPVFDPVHGVHHVFYLDHQATPGGDGSRGHWVSRDLAHWTQMPVALWNGHDFTNGKTQAWDTKSIWTGSATVVPGVGPGGAPGVMQIYPGLCHTRWGNCSSWFVLAAAVPADYKSDTLLAKWTKPDYNPIVNSTARDPSAAWRTPHGEWRLRTQDGGEYAAGSDADVAAGRWYTVGRINDTAYAPNPSFDVGECPSLFPLPPATPGFKREYAAARAGGGLPTHVMKFSDESKWRDFVRIGTYTAGAHGAFSKFSVTPGWEDVGAPRSIDNGVLYASKDGAVPTKGGGERRMSWGWARPQDLFTLPREVTFNAAARQLELAPAPELRKLRGAPLRTLSGVAMNGTAPLNLTLPPRAGSQSEVRVVFELPSVAAHMGVSVMEGRYEFFVEYKPPAQGSTAAFYEVGVHASGPGVGGGDTLRILASEKTLALDVFVDNTISEAYWQNGRVAMTEFTTAWATSQAFITVRNAPVTVQSAQVWPMKDMWVSPDEVLATPRSDQ